MVIFWKVLLLLMCRLIIVMLLLWLCGYWQRQEEARHNAIKVSMDSELNGL